MKDAIKFIRLLQRRRRLDKMLGTYYDRTQNNLYEDDCYRGYLHHATTVTGRLTSNLQQIPGAELSTVKKIYVTRYSK